MKKVMSVLALCGLLALSGGSAFAAQWKLAHIRPADSVIERFKNPFAQHRLLSISLNSVSKWKVRVMPSLLDYVQMKGRLPEVLAFSLAALIRFYMLELKDGTAEGSVDGRTYPVAMCSASLRMPPHNSRRTAILQSWLRPSSETKSSGVWISTRFPDWRNSRPQNLSSSTKTASAAPSRQFFEVPYAFHSDTSLRQCRRCA